MNSSWLKKKFLQLRLRDTKSTKSLLELTAKLFLSKAQRWFLQYFWPLLGLSGWPSAMQNSKKKIILQWKKETFILEPVCSRVKRAQRDGDALPESQIKVNWLGEKLFITFGGLGTQFTWHQIEPYIFCTVLLETGKGQNRSIKSTLRVCNNKFQYIYLNKCIH